MIRRKSNFSEARKGTMTTRQLKEGISRNFFRMGEDDEDTDDMALEGDEEEAAEGAGDTVTITLDDGSSLTLPRSAVEAALNGGEVADDEGAEEDFDDMGEEEMAEDEETAEGEEEEGSDEDEELAEARARIARRKAIREARARIAHRKAMKEAKERDARRKTVAAARAARR